MAKRLEIQQRHNRCEDGQLPQWSAAEDTHRKNTDHGEQERSWRDVAASQERPLERGVAQRIDILTLLHDRQLSADELRRRKWFENQSVLEVGERRSRNLGTRL